MGTDLNFYTLAGELQYLRISKTMKIKSTTCIFVDFRTFLCVNNQWLIIRFFDFHTRFTSFPGMEKATRKFSLLMAIYKIISSPNVHYIYFIYMIHLASF